VHNEFQKSAVLMGLGDRAIAVSDSVAHSMASRGVTSAKLRVVRNGPLDSTRTAQRAASIPVTLQHPAIISVAGMYVRKGIAPLLDAFARVLEHQPYAHLYLIGDGPDRSTFEARARELGIAENVHFVGFQPDPRSYLRAADVFVLASFAEPFALVLAEAREAGLAIVATSVGGTPEALDGGEAGTLVPPGDSKALADALCGLLEDKILLSRARARASRNIEWLSVKRMHRETLRVYQDLVTHRP
jgi:glycosyltransferase involved in cell wall biosynthesis